MKADPDLSLEIVILLVLGIFMLLFGFLLLKIQTGDLPYNPDGTYGLFLVIVSFQVITMGKTPFGDFHRSWALVMIGMGVAIVGMFVSFIPGYGTGFARLLVGIILLAGGLTLLAQLVACERKARLWMRIGGILQQLTFACGLVYMLTIASGALTLFPGFATDKQTAVLLVGYGVSFFYLSWCIWKVGKSYPPESCLPNAEGGDSRTGSGIFRNASLPLSLAMLILLGTLLTLLGLLLFPVNLGLLAFSPDGQLGLLLTVMAVQMMSLGDTPLGQFKRSPLLIITGLAFATLGVFSCIVPGVLTGMLTNLLGVLNIIQGATSLIKGYLPRLLAMRTPRAVSVFAPPDLNKMMTTQTALNCLAIVFGISMLVPGLVSGLLVAAILVANGLLLFVLGSFLRKVAGARQHV